MALLASGCVTVRPLPDGPGADNPELALQSRLEQAWSNTGLDGARPDVEVGQPVETEGGFEVIADCMGSHGHDEFGFSDGWSGPQLTQIGTTRLSDEMQVDFFTCFAASPTIMESATPFLTASQLDYLYDYYQELVIPCLAATGARVGAVPTREEFQTDRYGSWTPYESTINGNGLLTYPEAVLRCGNPRAGIAPTRSTMVITDALRLE